MKILNIKINFKMLISVVVSLIFILSIIYLWNLFHSHQITMNEHNYLQVLKDVHNNIYEYVGKEISLSGYIFRRPDFKENQFVIARNMPIAEGDVRIVGFLCESDQASNYPNETWVKAKGTVTLGDYQGPMPILKITELRGRVSTVR